MARLITASKILTYALLLLFIYSAWALGGVYPPWQWPLITISAIVAAAPFFLPQGEPAVIWKSVRSDPLFILGGLFLIILVVQSINSGYAVMWDQVDKVGMPDLPPHWVPWSVEPEPAAHMFRWFFPAWMAALTARHLLDRKAMQTILFVMVWNASILALVGLIFQALGAEKMLGMWDMPHTNFFATFGYINHGGAFFYLHAALAAGLAHRAMIKQLPPAQITVWMLCFLLCLSGSLATGSRAAGLACLVLVFAAVGSILHGLWKRSVGKSQLINVIGVGCVVLMTGLVLYFGSGEGALAQEIEETFFGTRMEAAVEGRTVQLPGAWQVATDYPVFGCGGWGYRWMALLYIPVNEWDLWRGLGKANVHCDPLQFLCEFGFVGSFLMAGAVGWLIVAYIRRWKKEGKASVLSKWIALGLLLVFAHSWVDLPYRCPAILIAWCFMLAALPKLSPRSNAWEECDE